MIDVLILSFFSAAFALGLYCLWVSLRVEVNRAPSYMRFGTGHPLNPVLGTAPIRPGSHSR
jgi:hypothetical protein